VSLFNLTACAQFQCINCNEVGSSGTPGTSTIASGSLAFYFCKMGHQTFTTSSTGRLGFFQCNYLHNVNKTFLTTSGTGESNIKDCVIMSGSSQAVSAGAGTTIYLRSVNIESS